MVAYYSPSSSLWSLSHAERFKRLLTTLLTKALPPHLKLIGKHPINQSLHHSCDHLHCSPITLQLFFRFSNSSNETKAATLSSGEDDLDGSDSLPEYHEVGTTNQSEYIQPIIYFRTTSNLSLTWCRQQPILNIHTAANPDIQPMCPAPTHSTGDRKLHTRLLEHNCGLL